jgi:hypothetical protein
MTDVPESFWDNLLDYIQDRTVVPVVGSEMVTVREGERDVPLDGWVARRLAADLGLPAGMLPAGFSLNDVVSMHQRRQGDRVELYAQIHRMLRNAALTPAEPLLALASIPGFDLFVSLTFDSLLSDALAAARGGARVEQIAYSPSTVRDLAGPKADLRQPLVFHLLGRSSASPDFAICDEDLLEFLHGLQDKQRQPKTLFDELRGNHLLFLGCSFGDWFTRFFLRTARSLELSQKRRRWDVLVGDCIAQDAGLVRFLESFSSDSRLVPLAAADFARELARRWHAAHPAATVSAGPAKEAATAGKSIPSGAIFVSYASEDLEAAGRLAEGLRTAGLEVWFDKNELRMGDDWASSIRRGIERCSLFLPVISRQSLSEENRRRYFWREWNDANDFARGMAPDEVFIVPVVTDATRIDQVSLPESFKRAQGRSLPDGAVTPDVAERLRELVRDFHRRQRAA